MVQNQIFHHKFCQYLIFFVGQFRGYPIKFVCQLEICNFSVSLAQPTLLPISSSTPTNNFKLGHATVLIWQLKKIFIILVITSTLLESSRFHVLKYIKASINPKVFTNFTFFQENSTLSPMTQASWFLIECQYLLTLIF